MEKKVYEIKKSGNNFIAFDKEGIKTGAMNIVTRKFWGATDCWQALDERVSNYKIKEGNKNKPKFYQAVLKPVKDIVKHCYPQSKNTTITERMGDENATCPECGENHWILLPKESCAVKEGGKPYMECMNCGYQTHF